MRDEINIYDKYIQRMTEIRFLSTPSLDGISNEESYSARLRENFIRIGKLAAENREFLDGELFPLLRSGEKLTDAQAVSLHEFCEKMLNAEVLDNLDPVITSMVAERLLKDSVSKGDSISQIHDMDLNMSTIYTLMNITDRIFEYPDIAMEYRKKGLEVGNFFRNLREHERFAAVTDMESRELILTNARYIIAFFENLRGYPDENARDIALLEESMAVYNDPFYRPLVPDYDWGYYRFRLLTYYAISPDFDNLARYNSEQLALICNRTEELWELWHEDPDQYREYDQESYIRILLARNRYLAGRLSEKEFLKEMLSIYENRKENDYEMGGIAENILIPAEMMCVLEKRELSVDEKSLLCELYNNVVNYAFLMPNSGILSYMLEYIGHFLQHFIEIPGEMSFEDIMLNMLAAMHPPTYIHSRMVAEITACLSSHLVEERPDLFIGICGVYSEDEVKKERERLIDFAYHAALCHDAGKLFIIDTVFVYGRRIEDMEFELIKTHPKMGAEILSRYPSTAAYADAAMGHHRWYDNSKGYPEEFDTAKSPLKTIIDIELCADCLDAATDTVGRSYNRGKTIDELIDELKEGSGTHYAPWLVDLITQEKVKADLEILLNDGREKNYRNTYQLLKTVHEQAKK